MHLDDRQFAFAQCCCYLAAFTANPLQPCPAAAECALGTICCGLACELNPSLMPLIPSDAQPYLACSSSALVPVLDNPFPGASLPFESPVAWSQNGSALQDSISPDFSPLCQRMRYFPRARPAVALANCFGGCSCDDPGRTSMSSINKISRRLIKILQGGSQRSQSPPTALPAGFCASWQKDTCKIEKIIEFQVQGQVQGAPQSAAALDQPSFEGQRQSIKQRLIKQRCNCCRTARISTFWPQLANIFFLLHGHFSGQASGEWFWGPAGRREGEYEWKCGWGGGGGRSSCGEGSIRFIIILDCYQLASSERMTERKIWKAEVRRALLQEDLILKQLFEVRKIKKWSEISRVMEKSYGIEGRNGKQCRERYHNHLKGGIKKEKWSPEQEKELVALHALHGNRWALISKLIRGRTENCVKNMLYSKLRKAIRQLNRFSYQYYRKALKEIKINFIYRLIEFTENSYKKTHQQRTPQENMALDIKNHILQLDLDDTRPLTESERERVRQLVEQIHLFKRLNQRFRGTHASRNRGRKIVKVEEVDEEEQDYAQLQEDSEQEEPMQEEELQEEALPQQPLKVKEESRGSSEKQTQEETKGHDSHSTHMDEAKEAICHVRPKISIVRMDSLDSNLSLLLVDAGLEQPIQTQQQFFNLTPTPNHPGIIQDWNVLSNTWRNNFTFE